LIVYKGIGLFLIVTLLSQPAIAATPPPASEDAPLPGEFRANVIRDSFLYRTAVSQPPVLNPGPVPVLTGDELIEVAYTDDTGALYDVQLNLTRATAKVLQGGLVVGYGTLTPIEVTTLREAGQNTAASVTLVEGILLAILGAVVEVVATIIYSEFSDRRQCERGVIAGNNQIVRDIRQCQSQGKSFTIHDSSFADCGSSAYASCN
jgi:hypothetical protein